VELPPLRSGYGGFPRKRLPNILHVLDLLEEMGPALGLPYLKKLAGTDLWEVRVRHAGSHYRLLYFAHTGRQFVVVHGFTKKIGKTPAREIRAVRQRQADFLARQGG